MNKTPRFAITGVGGYVAPRHLQAIKDVGGQIVAALDPHDSVGILDRFGRDIEFFTEPERFDRYLDHLRRTGKGIDWLSVCAPNHLHDAHCRMGMRNGANVICEKPLVLSPWNLDALAELERETERRMFTVLQLRAHPEVRKLYDATRGTDRPGVYGLRDHDSVKLTYNTPRGKWYNRSWKADPEKSGGLIMNIGVHLLDMLLWVFGPVRHATITTREDNALGGELNLHNADVTWWLSIANSPPCRELALNDGPPIKFDQGFAELHTEVYRATLAGNGHGIEAARPSIELAHRMQATLER